MVTDDESPGWLHMDSPFEIEADDAVKRFPGPDRDEQARAAHRVECGCEWPEFDWIDALHSWVSHVEDVYAERNLRPPPELATLRDSVDCRGGYFIDNVRSYHIARTALAAYDAVDRGLPREYMSGFIRVLLEVDIKIRTGELLRKDFSDSADWKSCRNCKRPFMPNQEGEEECNRCPK